MRGSRRERAERVSGRERAGEYELEGASRSERERESGRERVGQSERERAVRRKDYKQRKIINQFELAQITSCMNKIERGSI